MQCLAITHVFCFFFSQKVYLIKVFCVKQLFAIRVLPLTDVAAWVLPGFKSCHSSLLPLLLLLCYIWQRNTFKSDNCVTSAGTRCSWRQDRKQDAYLPQTWLSRFLCHSVKCFQQILSATLQRKKIKQNKKNNAVFWFFGVKLRQRHQGQPFCFEQ